MSTSLESLKEKTASWLRQGISPRRLALTLALGFAIGCFPLVGIPTALCALLAITLRLNLPVIQAANYTAMPLQVLLIVPFARLGGWLLSSRPQPGISAGALLHASPFALAAHLGGLAEQAILAWLVFAIPAVALLTLSLTVLLRRVPAVAASESAD